MGTTALKAAVAPMSLEAELRKLRERQGVVASEPQPMTQAVSYLQQPCSRTGCRCANPRTARFCRRCGLEIAA
jgi:hypothetical protein